ncbi:uncharacterized protein LOC123014618 [Tribolium madens]|uniref:uncharacterized protein LOC123014618 n=1 Tax=Tribolium madens TaxID=41895 RepID=UPI001CF72464|nr:uncharacterized protein LOC123014618 [Tribolium madens]
MESPKLVAIFFVIMVCLQVEGWVAIIVSSPGKKTGGCYTEKYNLGEMKVGEEKPVPGTCAQATCTNDGIINLEGCSKVVAEPPCYLTDGDLSKPFPHCCQEMHCKEENEI